MLNAPTSAISSTMQSVKTGNPALRVNHREVKKFDVKTTFSNFRAARSRENVMTNGEGPRLGHVVCLLDVENAGRARTENLKFRPEGISEQLRLKRSIWAASKRCEHVSGNDKCGKLIFKIVGSSVLNINLNNGYRQLDLWCFFENSDLGRFVYLSGIV